MHLAISEPIILGPQGKVKRDINEFGLRVRSAISQGDIYIAETKVFTPKD